MIIAAIVLLIMLAAGIGGFLLLVPQAPLGMQVLSAAFAALAVLTVIGLWQRQPWSPWTLLVALAFTATLTCGAWSLGVDPRLVGGVAVVTAAGALLALQTGTASPRGADLCARMLFGCVLVFAGWVAVWGWLFPAQFARALPINAPPLHARFLGAMYLSGAVFMLLGMMARRWNDIHVVTAILAVWTGLLGLVSILNLAAFDWTRATTWFWFVAYTAFPLMALWFVRHGYIVRSSPPPSPLLRPGASGVLLGIGGIASLIGLALLFAPHRMVTLWPWAVSPLLAQIYSAPFLAYGIGNLYAARPSYWSDSRIAVLGTLVFTIGVLVASWLHAGLFNANAPSTWVWFGGFGLTGLALFGIAATAGRKRA